MGVVFSGMFGIGIVLFTAVETDQHLDHILFGNILGIGREDLLVSGSVAAAVAVVLLAKWRDFLLFAFDPAQARASGLNAPLLHYGLLVLLSATVVATLSAVGIILAVALLVAPGAIAFLLARSFGRMLAVAVAVTLASTFAGVYAAFFIDSAPAPTIVLVLTGVFLLAFARRLAATRAATAGAAT